MPAVFAKLVRARHAHEFKMPNYTFGTAVMVLAIVWNAVPLHL